MGQDKGETVTEAPNIGQLKLEYQRALVGEAVLHEVIEKQRVRQEQLLENLRATYEGKHVRVSGPIIAEEQKAYNGTRDMFVVEDKSVVSFEGIAGWVSLERRGPTARIFGPSTSRWRTRP